MGIQQLGALGRGGETLADKAAHLIKHGFAAAFAEGVVIKTGQHMALFDAAAQPVVKRVLRRVVHHPVAAGYEQLHRRANCLRVGHHALGGVVQAQQNAHGNGAGNQRVAVVALLALAVVAQIVRFDIAVDEKIAAPFVEQAQAAAGKGHVEFDFESRRRKHGAADIGCVIVQPGRHQHRAHALGDNTNVLRLDAVGAADVADKGIDIGYRRADARAIAARAWAHAVAAGVPGEAGKIVQAQLVGHKHHAAGMLVAAVEQNQRFAAAAVGSGAVAVKQFGAVVGAEGFLLLLHGESFVLVRTVFSGCLNISRQPEKRFWPFRLPLGRLLHCYRRQLPLGEQFI